MVGIADIFVSYAQGDREWVKELATALEAEGFSIWWDPNLLPGTKFRDAINKELVGAKAVIVVWSRLSIESDWVRDEAEDARQAHKLIPVLKDPITPPHGGWQLQTANLSQWRGRREHPEFRSLVDGIRARVVKEISDTVGPTASLPAKPPEQPATAPIQPPVPEAPHQKTNWNYVAGIAAAVLIVAVIGAYMSGFFSSKTPAPAKPQVQTAATSSGVDPVELAMWNSVSGSNDAIQLKAYLDQYPNGKFAEIARDKVAALSQPKQQETPPPNPNNSTVAKEGGNGSSTPKSSKRPPTQAEVRNIPSQNDTNSSGGTQGESARAELERGIAAEKRQDYAQAMQWYQNAAAQGLPEAENNIGNLYSSGHGVMQDYGQAMQSYQKAAAQGFDLAKSNLARLEGIVNAGVAPNTAPARTGGDSCSEPPAPAAVDGTAATREQMTDAVRAVQAYMAASDQYQQCISDYVDAQDAQADKDKKPHDRTMTQTEADKVAANQDRKQKIGDAINAAIATYKRLHG